MAGSARAARDVITGSHQGASISPPERDGTRSENRVAFGSRFSAGSTSGWQPRAEGRGGKECTCARSRNRRREHVDLSDGWRFSMLAVTHPSRQQPHLHDEAFPLFQTALHWLRDARAAAALSLYPRPKVNASRSLARQYPQCLSLVEVEVSASNVPPRCPAAQEEIALFAVSATAGGDKTLSSAPGSDASPAG
jgi:hypothetical protein